MQATKEGNDHRFWTDSIQWWHAKAEQYLSMNDSAGVARCLQRAELALMNRKEVSGEILVYGPEIYLRNGA